MGYYPPLPPAAGGLSGGGWEHLGVKGPMEWRTGVGYAPLMPLHPDCAVATMANRDAGQNLPRNAVVVFGDVPAGRHAVDGLQRIGAHLQDEFEMVLWRFDLMRDPRWRAVATDDVAAAELVVFATSWAPQMRDFINDWMQECLAWKRGKLVAMLTPQGPSEPWLVWLRDLLQIYTVRPGKSARVSLVPTRPGSKALT